MLLKRLRPLALGLLLLVGGGTVTVVALAQRQKEPVGAEGPHAPADAGAPVSRAASPILKARIEMAREIVRQDMDRVQYMVDPGSDVLVEVPVWSRHLMEDRLRLAATRAERVEAIRDHRNLMIRIERLMGQMAAAGQSKVSDALKGKYYRLEADQFLAEAGGDPEKEAPAAEPAKSTGPPPPAPPSPGPDVRSVRPANGPQPSPPVPTATAATAPR